MNSLKRLLFRLAGLDPEAVVVSFASSQDPELVRGMFEEVRRIIPDRRHFVLSLADQPHGDFQGAIHIRLSSHDAYLEAGRALRGFRIGMAPVLFDGSPHPLRSVAFALAPAKILAYNRKLERHHLHWRSPIASLLFWQGAPLDRIWLRPRWWPFRREQTVVPLASRQIPGRALSPSRGRISVLTPYLPYPLTHGGAVRLYYLLKNSAIEFDIDLYAFVEQPPSPDELRPVQAFCANLFLVEKPRYREPRWSTLRPPEVEEYRSPAMQSLVEQRPARVLQTEYTQLASYGGDILVEHDITFDLYRQVHQRKQSLGSWWDLWRWERFEKQALRRSPHVVVMSEKDAALSQHPRAAVIANGVDLNRFRPSPEPAQPRLLFIGSFRHFPNVVAARFFLGEVWPRLVDRFPNLETTIVAGPDPLLHWGERSLPNLPRVTIMGYVADVAPLYDQATIVVVPTLESAGTNIKVLEAMAMERAVVSTSSGCAGIGLTHGQSVWVADSGEAFADGIATLLTQPNLRRRIATSARRLAADRFSWSAIARTQRDLWRKLTPVPLRLERAIAHHVASITRIQAAAPEAAQWSDCADYLNHLTWVATLDAQIVGFIVTRQTAPDEAEILNLAVDPGWRGHGIGARLLEVGLAALNGDIYLEVRESNHFARRFYEQAGFRQVTVRQGYYEPIAPGLSPESGIVMRIKKC